MRKIHEGVTEMTEFEIEFEIEWEKYSIFKKWKKNEQND